MSSDNERETKPRNIPRRRCSTLLLFGTVLASALAISASVRSAQAQEVLPRPEPAFEGTIGRTVAESTPDFPAEVQAPEGAPNILLILTDDVGFGASSTFGGPIATPVFDRLAANGLRYNRFHTTAICSPSRAALITGRNHHSCATGIVMEFGTGYPGYNTLMPRSCGTVAEVLKQNGYNTSWFGKNHNVPDWHGSQAGPFDLWPTGLGFEYFYGFLGGETNQWASAIIEGTKPIEAEEQRGPNPRHFDELMADKAIDWIRLQNAMAPDKPFFAYYATGTPHMPHHAPKEWIAKFAGQFDQGWDKVREETLARQKKLGVVPTNTELTPRPDEIPAWDLLNVDQKRLFARMMEVYAGTLAHADYQIGRIIDAVAGTGEIDNTVVVYIQGDNGSSAEGSLQGTTAQFAVLGNGVPESLDYLLTRIDDLGGPTTDNHFPVGWAHATNAPFKWAKQVASHFGGTRTGMVISWPAKIKDKGGLRTQFSHLIDIVPTLYEAAGIQAPDMVNGVKQKPIEGVSLVYSFDDANARDRHTTQYFEVLGNRGVYREGWMASTTPARVPWVTQGKQPNPDDFQWELYNVEEDFSQATDLAQKHPDKLKELLAAFDQEAKKYNVYPLDSSAALRLDPSNRPSLTRGRTVFTYYPGMVRIPEGTTPDVKNKSYSVTAEVEIPAGGADGVLAVQGARSGGWGLLVMDGKPQFVHAYSNQPQHKFRVTAKEPLYPGKHTIRFDFQYDGGGVGKGGMGTLLVDGKQVAQSRIERTVPNRFSVEETFDVGEDTGTPVVEDYADRMPFRFTGTIEKVTIELK